MFNIGKIFNTVAQAVGNAAEQVSKVAGGFERVGTTLLAVLKTPMNQLVAPIAKLVGEKIGEMVGKLPFVGPFLGPIVGNLVKNAGSLVSKSTLGTLGFLVGLAPKVKHLTEIAQAVKAAADKIREPMPNSKPMPNKVSAENVQNIFAHRHAQILRNAQMAA
jgi:hypothetical protein